MPRAESSRAELWTWLADSDTEQVKDLAGRVHAAIAGDLVAAYRDRSGETRSL